MDNSVDVEAGKSRIKGLFTGNGNEAFKDTPIRHAFIRKVYAVLVAQLLVTEGIIGIFFISEVRNFTATHAWIHIVAIVLVLVLLFVLVCLPNYNRRFPCNLLFLGGITFSMGNMFGCVSAYYNIYDILIAVGVVIVVFAALFIFAFQNKIDFTVCFGILFATCLVLIIFGIVAACFKNYVVNMVYASLGAFIFSCYIIVDTQMIMGGKHNLDIDPKDYLSATLKLYLDIVNLCSAYARLFVKETKR
jgi:FtsH-binding integral membrane protein